MRTLTLIYLVILLGLPSPTDSQFEAEKTDVNPWSHLDFKNDPDDFQFVIITDHTGGHRAGIWAKAMKRINLLQPEFVVSVGDIIEGYTENVATLEAEWEEMEGMINTLNMPFFYVPGNHDISNSTMLEVWKKRFGRNYTHFVYKNVLFLLMDSEDPPATNVGEAQLAYMEKALADNPDVRWTLLFIHKPMWVYDNKRETWVRMDALLKNRPHTAFAGHRHRYIQNSRLGREYYTLATTGGSSDLSGLEAGRFDHVTWLTMTDEGPLIANLMLDGIQPGDLRTDYTASLTTPLIRRRSMLTGPLLVQNATFDGGRTTIRIHNPGDRPLQAKAAFEVHEDLRPTPRSFDVTVAPGETEEIPVEVGIEMNSRIADLEPLFLGWTLQYDLPDHESLRVEGKNRMLPEQVIGIDRLRTPPTLDGLLGDWKELPLRDDQPAQISQWRRTWQGPADGRFRFAVGADEEYLYVAVRTYDDEVVQGKDKSRRRKDGLVIQIDGQAEPNRSQSQATPQEGLTMTLRPGETFTGAENDRFEFPEGLRAVCVATDDGMTAEIAIPAAYLDAKQGSRWETIRLNVSFYDYDTGHGRGSQLWWRPEWRSARSYAGSGTFIRK